MYGDSQQVHATHKGGGGAPALRTTMRLWHLWSLQRGKHLEGWFWCYTSLLSPSGFVSFHICLWIFARSSSDHSAVTCVMCADVEACWLQCHCWLWEHTDRDGRAGQWTPGSTEMSRGKRTASTWEQPPTSVDMPLTQRSGRGQPPTCSGHQISSVVAKLKVKWPMLIYIFNTTSIYLICTCFKNTV